MLELRGTPDTLIFIQTTTAIQVNKLENVWSTCHSINQQYSIMFKAIMSTIYVFVQMNRV